ncbi:MAG TPA: hypothetical protein VFB80_16465 [Pirellulaceae bacterium]|nr:hypothetical protein [Pirellulaceae bacterium]
MKANLVNTSVLSIVGLLMLGGVAAAQTFATPSGGVTESFYGGGYGGGYGYFSSTYEEGVLRGLGYLRRSTGEMNYFNSLSNINNQEAAARYLVNREKATETYFRMQQINRAAREATRPERLTAEQQIALARQQAPNGLNPAQYNRELGRLSWPAALSADMFAPERLLLDRAFAARAPSDAGDGSAFHSQVKQLTLAMDAKLKEHLPLLSTTEYMAAKKFILGLSVESRQPMIFGALASK